MEGVTSSGSKGENADFCTSSTLRYFKVLWGNLKYFKRILRYFTRTLKYSKLLWSTLSYFKLLWATLKYLQPLEVLWATLTTLSSQNRTKLFCYGNDVPKTEQFCSVMGRISQKQNTFVLFLGTNSRNRTFVLFWKPFP